MVWISNGVCTSKQLTAETSDFSDMAIDIWDALNHLSTFRFLCMASTAATTNPTCKANDKAMVRSDIEALRVAEPVLVVHSNFFVRGNFSTDTVNSAFNELDYIEIPLCEK